MSWPHWSLPSTTTCGRRAGLIALFSADVISVLGNRVSMVAIPWLVLQTTGSAAKMGLIAGAEMLPYVISGVVAAPLADRFGLRRTSILTDVGSTLAMVAIAAGRDAPFLRLVVLVAIAGTLRGLGDRVKHVMLKPMAEVAGVRMIRVTSAYEGFTKGATLIGAPLGGLMILWFGANGAIWIDAVSFAVCAALIATLVRPPAAAEQPEREPYLTALRGGFAYLRSDRLLLGMIAMIFVLNVLNQAGTAVYVPLWVNEVFGSPAELGVVFGGFAAGALLGNGAIAFIGIPIGGVLAGWSVAWLGLRPAILAMGVLLLVATVVPLLRVRGTAAAEIEEPAA